MFLLLVLNIARLQSPIKPNNMNMKTTIVNAIISRPFNSSSSLWIACSFICLFVCSFVQSSMFVMNYVPVIKNSIPVIKTIVTISTVNKSIESIETILIVNGILRRFNSRTVHQKINCLKG